MIEAHRVTASALVTGAASGLGAAVAARLQAEGLSVVGLDLTGGTDMRAGDVRSEEDVAAAVRAAEEHGPLRVAVACAGICPAARLVGREGPHDLAVFNRAIGVNLDGSFNLLRLAASSMVGNEPDEDRQRGLVVLVSSIAAYEGQIGQIAYAASKAGVAGMVLPAARDLASRGVRVVGIAPGTFDTPMLAGLPEAARAALADAVPNPARLGRPDEVADLVVAIMGNVMLNGTTIRLDGALRMGPR
jgi:NAD(P)-dependent dehydrogenase (short-subunit alcohol dehydrogenase family)